MTTRLILAAVFATLALVANAETDMGARFDDFARSWTSENWGDSPGQRAVAEGWGLADPTQELRRRFGIDPRVTDAQIQQHFRQNDLPGPVDNQSNWHQLGDFGRQMATFAAIGLGGPIGGPIAAANASGASSDAGIPPAVQLAAQVAGTAYSGGPNMPNPDASPPPSPPPAGGGAPPMQVAQAPGATMTDVSGGLSAPQMPPAQVPADPSFGGHLEQVSPGVWSNTGNLGTFGTINPGATVPTPTGGQNPDATKDDKAAPAGKDSSIADKFRTAAYGTAAAGTLYGLLSPKTGAPDGQAVANQLQETEAQRQARVQAATDSVNKAFAGYDDPYYSSIADAYRNYQSPLYNEQVTEARRTLPMSVPNTQSSAYERRARQLETDIQRGQTDLNSQAIQQANQRRGEIDFQKADLMNMAAGGAEASTVADAAGQRAQLYSAPPQFSPIADMFQKYSADAANYALAGAANSGASAPRIVQPLSFSRSPSSSQRIVA